MFRGERDLPTGARGSCSFIQQIFIERLLQAASSECSKDRLGQPCILERDGQSVRRQIEQLLIATSTEWKMNVGEGWFVELGVWGLSKDVSSLRFRRGSHF